MACAAASGYYKSYMAAPRDKILIDKSLVIDPFGDDARQAFVLAADSGYNGVAFSTRHPELNPEKLGSSARRHVRRILAGHNLGVSSIYLPTSAKGLADPDRLDELLHRVEEAVNLAYALGVTQVGLYGGDTAGLGSPAARDAAKLIAELSDRSGVQIALSGDDPTALAKLLRAVAHGGLHADLQTQRLLGQPNIIAAAELLAGLAGQMTCADGIKAGQKVRAVPLGHGAIPWSELLKTLNAHEFAGPALVDVRHLSDPVGAARTAALALSQAAAEISNG